MILSGSFAFSTYHPTTSPPHHLTTPPPPHPAAIAASICLRHMRVCSQRLYSVVRSRNDCAYDCPSRWYSSTVGRYQFSYPASMRRRQRSESSKSPCTNIPCKPPSC